MKKRQPELQIVGKDDSLTGAEHQLVKLAELEALGEIDDDDTEFVRSLLANFRRNGFLSQKQWYWVGKIVKKVETLKRVKI